MDAVPTNTEMTTSEQPRTYTVIISDTNTGDVIEKYDTEIAILFGVKGGDLTEVTGNVKTSGIYIGNGYQLATLLSLLNQTVGSYLAALFNREEKFQKTGEPKLEKEMN